MANIKRFRTVSVYYRDEDKVMRKIPHVKAHLDKGVVFKVYTLPPAKLQEMEL